MTSFSPDPPPEVCYSASDDLRIREFDDDAVVFEPVSWDAHILNPAARAVLELLIEEPRTEPEVTAFLRNALAGAERDRAGEHARRLLSELQSLGLVKAIEGIDRAPG